MPWPSGLNSGGGGSPSLATRTAWPLWIPAGILIASSRLTDTRPLPRQSRTSPVPRATVDRARVRFGYYPLLLILLVLLHSGKGGGLSDMFGGGMGASAAGSTVMERNLDRRVEVAFPILNERLKQEVLRFLELQWADNVKARSLDRGQANRHIPRRKGARRVRSQVEWYQALRHASGGTIPRDDH